MSTLALAKIIPNVINSKNFLVNNYLDPKFVGMSTLLSGFNSWFFGMDKPKGSMIYGAAASSFTFIFFTTIANTINGSVIAEGESLESKIVMYFANCAVVLPVSILASYIFAKGITRKCGSEMKFTEIIKIEMANLVTYSLAKMLFSEFYP